MDLRELNKIYEALPSNWSEVKLKQFQELTELDVIEKDEFYNLFVGTDNTANVLSYFSGVSADDVKNLPLKEFSKLASKINFMFTVAPNTNKPLSFKIKRVEDFTYSNFVTYQMFFSNPLPHLHLIVKDFMKESMSEDEVLEMDIETVLTAFFLCMKAVKESAKRTQIFLRLKLMKQILVERLQHFRMNLMKKKQC